MYVTKANKVKVILSLTAVMMIAGTSSAYAKPKSVSQLELNQVSAVTQAKSEKTLSIQDQINKLSAGLKPGQMIAYYVKDKKQNPLDQISFMGKGFVYQDYNTYLVKAKKTNAPALTQPADLPKGYKFTNGLLYLQDPDKSSDLYKKLEKELKAQAAKGGKSIYSTKFEANEVFSSVLKYIKGKVEVVVVATRIQPSSPLDGTPVPFTNPNITEEAIKIGGIECIYTNDKKGLDHLDWSDTENQVRYTIWAESAKSDVLSFARNMLES
ncbi:hypothetical protein [Paenibacillus segetis]|uniref:Uncharacterized protein n=1 Tax=Paenibacillus segetis TaxID=1325360 RepID=A0ABQ1YEB9_9BACL|nr:hypothetical protein [Paenibacillus segetis]GGH21428.1 hypothetical protein GCM10008013_19320 [Paenibacillus segetis]